MQETCHYLKEDYGIGSGFCLIGSVKKNLMMQGVRNPSDMMDLDYDLEIRKCDDFGDCRYIRECVRSSFNKALHLYTPSGCEDSTSCLTSKPICSDGKFKSFPIYGVYPYFTIDLCITKKAKKRQI